MVKAVRRENQPAASDRVCFIHFADGLATDENPMPTLFLGYKSKEKNSRRTLFRKTRGKVKIMKKSSREGDITPATSTSEEEEVPLPANYYDRGLSHD